MMKTKTKKREHPRLPAGFGTIRYLGEGRRNPYAVHPPAMNEGRWPLQAAEAQLIPSNSKRRRALCYVADWYVGLAVLASWHAGTYYTGMEHDVALRSRPEDIGELIYLLLKKTDPAYADRFLPQTSPARDERTRFLPQPLSAKEKNPRIRRAALKNAKTADLLQRLETEKNTGLRYGYTIKEIYELYYAWKFGAHAARKHSDSSEKAAYFTFQKLKPIENRLMDDLTIFELQDFVNSIGMSRTTVSRVVQLIRHLYKFAYARELCAKDCGQYVILPDTKPEVHHQDFSDEELAVLWQHTGDPVVRMILIMCYSGFRISAYEQLEIHLEQGYFKGGIKTASGRGRTVPIHSSIHPFVEEIVNLGGFFCDDRKVYFHRRMEKVLKELGIDNEERHHTPHSCRHTFSRLCESFKVNEADRKRMMGHSLSNDITNGVYGHRSLEELKTEIEKIQAPVRTAASADRSSLPVLLHG